MCINRYYRTQFGTTGFSNTFVVYNNTFKIRFGGEEMGFLVIVSQHLEAIQRQEND